jgi:Reverse transcriptase (RNA-dependent DNA polymerase)
VDWCSAYAGACEQALRAWGRASGTYGIVLPTDHRYPEPAFNFAPITAEHYHLLSNNHFVCRPGCTTTDALHYVTWTTKNAWIKGRVVGVLFLAIKGARPSIILDRLTHNMRKRGIPAEYTDWIHRKVEGRLKTLRFDDYSNPEISIEQGMDQGCPLSAIAYQFYNTGLLEIVQPPSGEDCIGFVDDTTIIAEGKDLKEAFGLLTYMMTRDAKQTTGHEPMNATSQWKGSALWDSQDDGKRTR